MDELHILEIRQGYNGLDLYCKLCKDYIQYELDDKTILELTEMEELHNKDMKDNHR